MALARDRGIDDGPSKAWSRAHSRTRHGANLHREAGPWPAWPMDRAMVSARRVYSAPDMRTSARTSPVAITWSVMEARKRLNLPRDEASGVRRWQTIKLPPTTNEELIATLVRAGGRVLARQAHGVLLAIHKHLVFVSSTLWVAEEALSDALRAARLTPERFLELRASAATAATPLG